MKIPFNIKFKPQIESGEYKVVLDCGIEAEILAWNKPGDYPIVCMAKKEGAIPFRTDNNGIAYHYPEGSNYSDLFIVTLEKEMTPFEKGFLERVFHQKAEDLDEQNKETFLEDARYVLGLAREQFIKDGYVIEKKAFHDAVEKVPPEVMKEVSESIDKVNKGLTEFENVLGDIIKESVEKEIGDNAAIWAIARGHTQKLFALAREEVLKDLPRWKKLSPPYYENSMGYDSANFIYKGRAISIAELIEKLPGFKDDENYE